MVKIMQGDVIEMLKLLPEKSVHCVVTSPPYWGLRAYGGDPGMIGLEPTFERHLSNLVTVFREVRRVLRTDGTCWLNYGDAYVGGGRGEGVKGTKQATNVGSNGAIRALPKSAPGLKPKDLMMMPARVALALQADGWWLRSEIIWHKPNPMPESVTDRPTSAHEKIYLLTKSAKYFYDAEAVRVEAKRPNWQYETPTNPGNGDRNDGGCTQRKSDKQRGHARPHEGFQNDWDGRTKEDQQASGANLRNVWTMATYSFKGAHFATFPPELVERCVKAGTSETGCCHKCGMAWVREVEKSGGTTGKSWHDHRDDKSTGQSEAIDIRAASEGYKRETPLLVPRLQVQRGR